jgi:hypothetical protein
MTRRANKNPPIGLAIVVVFEPHERRTLKWNERPESGNFGGWPRLENRLIELTDQETGICSLGPEDFTRLIVYLTRHYGSGGPNGRVRSACIPVLRRAGIDLLPAWRAPDAARTVDDEEDSHATA